MSTIGEIGVIDNNKVKVIYNHFDSYLSGVGKDLLENWNSKEKALKVINGDYNNEDLKYEFDSVEEWINHLNGSDREYIYLFKDDKWYYTESNNSWEFKNDWKLLDLIEINAL